MKSKTFASIRFTIDRPKGTVKEWPQPDGSIKRFVYPVDYGYLPRHTGEDDEGLDFFVGDQPDGHLESFQKLRRHDDGKQHLDETKFLVGVTDVEREAIYRLYGPEVWRRRTYRDMDQLMREAAKFKAAKKGRYKQASEEGDLYGVLASMEKDAFSLRDTWQRISQSLRGHVPHMMPLENVRPHGGSNFSLPEVRPWKKPSWESPSFKPAPTLGSQPPIPQDYHPGMGAVSNWMREEHHPAEVMTMYPHDAPSHQQMDRLPRNDAMRMQVLRQTGVDDMNRGIMSELARKYEGFGGASDPDAQSFLKRIAQGEAPGYQAAYNGIMQHYPKQASLRSSVWARFGFKGAAFKMADIDKRTTGEVMATKLDAIDGLFNGLTQKTGMEKRALTPAALSAMGAGLGAGLGAVHGFYTDDPTKSVEHHMWRALGHAGVGGVGGGATGYGLSRLIGKLAPEAVEAARKGPWSEMRNWSGQHDPNDPNAPFKAIGQGLYDTWMNPAVRFGAGTYMGATAGKSIVDALDDWRLQQHAAQREVVRNPDEANAASVGAAKARRHMGEYSSSLDRTAHE